MAQCKEWPLKNVQALVFAARSQGEVLEALITWYRERRPESILAIDLSSASDGLETLTVFYE